MLLLAAVLLAGMVLLPKIFSPQAVKSPAGNNDVAVAHAPVIVSNPPVSHTAISQPPVFVVAPVINTNAAAEHEKYVAEQIHRLNDLAMNDDTASRDTILSELKNNPDKEIRAAALEAAIQFDDRSVVPPMQQIAAETQDPEEKAAILEAIDYINLPSLSEYAATHPLTPRVTPKIPPARIAKPAPVPPSNDQ